MKKSICFAKNLKCLGVAALLWNLITPLAVAGPVEDTELALKEYNRGDLVVSMALWRKAANEGYAPAQVWLGYILDSAEENDEAFDWYRKATAQGSAAGEFGLGQMYLKGEGVKKDVDQGRIHVLRAAELNHVDAMMAVMESYRVGGMGLTANPAEADAWERKVIAVFPEYKKLLPVVKDKKGKAK